MQDYPVLNTQVVGRAESALGAIFDPILDRAGTTFHQWLVLTLTMAATTAKGGTADHGELVARIADARKIDPAEVETAMGELHAAGLLQFPDATLVSLTEGGRARHAQIRRAVEEVTARLFDFPAQDLATAGRVLSVITARADAELAGRLTR
jgi:DNA-binding MarR family transcriptional regulator